MTSISLSSCLLAACLTLIAACSARPYAIDYPVPFEGVGSHPVWLVSHGWHTGFVLPASALQQRLPVLRQRFPDTPWLEIGWGDRGFYQAPKITSGLTLRAILWPTESVVHAVAIPEQPDRHFANSQVLRLCLTEQELSTLARFLDASFARDSSNEITPLQHGLYGDSQFYRGEGSYYLLNTCNNWTAKGLASFGVDITPMFTLRASGVMSAMRDVPGVVGSDQYPNSIPGCPTLSSEVNPVPAANR